MKLTKILRMELLIKKEFDTMKNELSKRVLKYSTSQNSMLKNENKQLNKNIIIISMPLIILLFYFIITMVNLVFQIYLFRKEKMVFYQLFSMKELLSI